MSNFLDKKWKPTPRGSASSQLTARAAELKSSLRSLDLERVAAQSGVSSLRLDSGRVELRIPLWGEVHALTWPHLESELPPFIETLILYYLLSSDGAPLTGKWVSFADLPDGRMYNSAFQGYTGDLIAKSLDLDSFKSSCANAGGQAINVGDASYIFQALPRVPLMLTYWLGDEDFPSSCKILFDSSATHYLPIDGCAILGSMLTKRIVK
jgi:hypothetical protein